MTEPPKIKVDDGKEKLPTPCADLVVAILCDNYEDCKKRDEPCKLVRSIADVLNKQFEDKDLEWVTLMCHSDCFPPNVQWKLGVKKKEWERQRHEKRQAK